MARSSKSARSDSASPGRILSLVSLLILWFFHFLVTSTVGQDASSVSDCGYGNITEICCNDFGCCWSTNDSAFGPIGCFNMSEILETTSTIMSTSTTNLYTTTTAAPTTTIDTMTTAAATTTNAAATTTTAAATTPTAAATTTTAAAPTTVAPTTTMAAETTEASTPPTTDASGITGVAGGKDPGQSSTQTNLPPGEVLTSGVRDDSTPTNGPMVDVTTGSDGGSAVTDKPDTGGPGDSYNDPDFLCFNKHIRKSYSPDIIFLTGSYTPQQCFDFCNKSFTCMAFQVSRSGSGVCGYFQTSLAEGQFLDSSTTSIYTFSKLCAKASLVDSCTTSKWYNTTYRCMSGLVATSNINNEGDCKAYCACGLDNCMAAVVRNATGTVECYVVLRGSDLSNFQLCNVAVKQYIIKDIGEETYGVTKSPGSGTGSGPGGGSGSGNLPGFSPYYNSSCWNPPEVENAHHYLHKDAYGMAVVYVCRQGYLFPSGERVRTLVCSRLAWGTIQPKCQPTTCSFPPLVYQPFETRERSCPSQSGSKEVTLPYFRNGRKVESSKCTVKKLVSVLVPLPSECNFTCESPLFIYNTTASFLPRYQFVDYKCFKGHRFPDGRNKKTVRCFDNGTWPETDPCSALFCDEIYGLRKVALSSRGTIHGTVLTVSCEKGYMFPQNVNSKVVECVEALENDRITAVWNDTIEACTDVICTSPHKNETSRTTSTDPNVLTRSFYAYRESIEFVCNDFRLKFDDGTKKRQLTCWDNGLWNFDNVHCGARRCDPIPYIVEATPSSILALKGQNVTFTCNIGFWYEPGVYAMWIRCDGNQWSQPKYTKCEVVTCPIGSDDSAQWNTTQTIVAYGNSVGVHCLPGHYMAGTSREATRTVRCTEFGNWSREIKCLPVNCGPIVGVNRASVEVEDDEVDPLTTYNSTVRYSCLEGHWFGRDGYQMVARCSENGEWSVDGITEHKKWRSCVEIACLPLLCYVAPNVTTTVGSSGNVTCPQDRKFKGVGDTVVKVFCNSRGEWMPELPECVATQKILNMTVAEAPKADVIAAVAVVLVTVEITCFVIVDIPLIKASVKFLVTNLGRLRRR